jgi:plastocyanin
MHKPLLPLLLAAAIAPLAIPANAAAILVHLTDHSAATVADAVVTVTLDSGKGPEAVPAAPADHVIDQKNETFVPYVEVLRPGDHVVFRNSDRTRHHVYSFSKIKTFEFVLKPGDSSPPLTMDKTGIAAVGCNIHDHMISYLVVSDAPRIAKSGADGNVKLDGLPAGTYTVHVWHPQLHPSRPEMTQSVQLASDADGKSIEFTMSLLLDPRMQMQGEY